MTNKEFRDLIALAIYDALYTLIKKSAYRFGLWCIVMLVAIALYNYSEIGRDSTDGQDRSGMKIYTDNLTGCEYLGSGSGGLTPRVDLNDHHLGCGS